METIPFNELKRMVAEGPSGIEKTISDVLTSGWWLNGQETRAFCEEFAAYVGVEDCLAVANGTDALEIAMRAILAHRPGTGREVVTVANAGGYSTIACRVLGLTPVYADIEEASQLVSIASVIAALGPDTRLVVVTHLYGGGVDVPALRREMDAASYADVPILEDCAQAHGVRLGDWRAGSMGDIATFSFYPTKNLGAFGDGGAIAGSDRALMAICRQLNQYGWASKYRIEAPFGRNSRMDEVQAAFLRRFLPGLDAANARRVAILDRYAAAAPAGITVVRNPEGTVAHLAVVLSDRRDALKAHLAAHGVQTDIHYPILDCDQPGWAALPQRQSPTGLPVSRASVERLLTLPCYPTLRDDEVERICATLASWEA